MEPIASQVLQNSDDPNEIIVILEYQSVKEAKKFSESEGLRLSMQRAGVNSVPNIIFVNELEKTNLIPKLHINV